MERLLIIVAVLACVAAGIAVMVMSARGRRAPLRLDSEFDPDDTDLIIGPVGARPSPIDRSAQVIGPDEARTIEHDAPQAPRRGLSDAPR